jgi:MFS family permease
VIAVQRLCYGVWTVCTVLLYRNYFTDDGFFRAGLAGLGQVVAAVATGGALAALVTPSAFRRFGAVSWPGAMLAISAVLEIALVLPYSMPWLLLGALLLSLTSQATKISVDTVIQHEISDAFRGRVFALYDMLFNLALVLAAVLTALVLPEDGHSPPSVFALAAGWAMAAMGYLSRSRRTSG